MKGLGRLRGVRVPGLVIVASLISGCASNYSHYGSFTAQNSAGETRQFRVSWKSADYPDWWIQSDQATPIILEGQCTKRVWRLTDASMDEHCGGEGVTACATPGEDLDWHGKPIARAEHVCMTATDMRNASKVADLGGQIDLTVSCYPVNPKRKEGKKTFETDYLKASVVPYVIQVKKVPLHSLNERPQPFDKTVCSQD